jgi:hypothetical protein
MPPFNPKSSKSWQDSAKCFAPFAAIFIFLGLALCHSWISPDIWYQLSWGRSLVENLSFLPTIKTLLVQPIFANVYWLFQIVVYELFQWGGIYLVSVLFLILWFAISAFWIAQTGVYRSPVLGAIVFLGFGLCVQTRFEARPEVFSFLFLSAMLLLASRIDVQKPLTSRLLIQLGIIQILWTNSHGYAALGPLIGVAMLLGLLWDRQKYSSTEYLRGLKVVLLLIACSFVSPFGWGVWQTVIAFSGVSSSLRDLNAELMPLNPLSIYWPMQLFWAFWVSTTFWGFWSLLKRRDSFSAFLGLAGSALAIQAVRNGPLYFLLSAPVIEVMFKRASSWRLNSAWAVLPTAAALALSFAVINGSYFAKIRSLTTFGVHEEKSAYPIGAVKYLQDIHFKGRLFNDSYDGGYLEYHLPEVLIFGDSYFSDGPVTLSYFKAIREYSAFHRFDIEFHFDALLLNIENLDFLFALQADNQWKLVYADLHRLLFVRGVQFDQLSFNLDSTKFYDGEDLTQWTYEFGIVNWAGIALKDHSLPLMKKIVHDVSDAPAIPGNVIKYALIAAGKSGDKELLSAALKVSNKIFISSEEDVPGINQVLTQARATP